MHTRHASGLAKQCHFSHQVYEEERQVRLRLCVKCHDPTDEHDVTVTGCVREVQHVFGRRVKCNVCAYTIVDISSIYHFDVYEMSYECFDLLVRKIRWQEWKG